MKPLEKTEELKAQEETLKDKDPLKLPAEVEKLYQPAPGIVRVFMDTIAGDLVDLNKVSLSKAEKLAARGILVKK